MPIALYLTLLCVAAPAVAGAELRITADADPTRVVVRRSLAAEIAATLPMGVLDEAVGRGFLTLTLVDEKTGKAETPLFGTYQRRDSDLEFRPRFGLVRDCRYRATALAGGGQSRVVATAEYEVPPIENEPPTEVTAVSPSGERLPANLLKFYVWFSRPMREGREVHERIRLFDGAGREIDAPWRDLELWNADATRLTLFIHPGRIKQGVNLREEQGPVLQPGKKYVLVVGADLRDARGVPLGKELRHTFTASEEVRWRVDIAQWKLTVPPATSREPLSIRFDRPLDLQMAERCLHVRDAAGEQISGTVRISGDQGSATFVPATAWQPQPYQLHVESHLEDLSGNTLERAFDDELASQVRDAMPARAPRAFTPR